MKSLKMLWDNYGVGSIIILLFALYVLYMIYDYVSNKSSFGSENVTSSMNPAYQNGTGIRMMNGDGSGPVASNTAGQNEVFAPANGIQSSMVPTGGSSVNPNITNPSDLLPINSPNSQWSELNPTGKGELSNINFLKAGYHIGIDSIGQTMRNANLQLRSEPANPQVNTGPWNQSTIAADTIRPAFEIGQGSA